MIGHFVALAVFGLMKRSTRKWPITRRTSRTSTARLLPAVRSRAEDDDKAVVSEAPYRIRRQLTDALAPERDTALDRVKETFKRLFIDRQLALLDEDRLYYLGNMAEAANDQDGERYLTARVGR